MPELANRDKHEAALTAALVALFDKQRQEAPNRHSWKSFAPQLRDTLALHLEAVYLDAVAEFFAVHKFEIDHKRYTVDARAWADRYASVLANVLTNNLQRDAAEAIETATKTAAANAENNVLAHLSPLLLILFDESRAAGVAITEVTRSISAAELATSQTVRTTSTGRLVAVDRQGQVIGGQPWERGAGSQGQADGKPGSGADQPPGETVGERVAFTAIWNTERDARVCPVCKPLDGRDRVTWGQRFPQGPPAHPRCVLPGMIVDGRISGALKAFYSGQAIEFTTATGIRLAVTANHPVLTPAGFVLAGAIGEGQYLLRDQGVIETPTDVSDNEYQPPSRIEDVFGTLAKNAELRSCANAAAVDFHGDEKSIQGNVDIVWPYRVLLAGSHAQGDEGTSKQGLIRSDMQLLGEAGFGAKPLFCGCMHVQPRGFPGGSALSLDGRPVPLELRPLDPLLLGNGAHLGAMSEQVLNQAERDAVTSDPASGDSGLFGKLIERLPGVVSPDKVVNVRQFHYSGHVYDLSTVDGWYCSNRILVHNCRCFITWRLQPVPSGGTP